MTSQQSGATITVVAVGPGDPRMLTLRGQQALQAADAVAAFQTVLNVVSQWTTQARLLSMTYRNQEEMLDQLAELARQGKRCVVCAWGDLNVSARELLERAQRRVDHVELIPGISSVQFAMARSGIFLEESLFLTLHKRDESHDDLGELTHYLKEGLRHVILIPRPWDLMPPKIAAQLVAAGLPPERPVIVYQKLSWPDEKRWQGSLAQCAAITEELSDLSIMVFPRPAGARD